MCRTYGKEPNPYLPKCAKNWHESGDNTHAAENSSAQPEKRNDDPFPQVTPEQCKSILVELYRRFGEESKIGRLDTIIAKYEGKESQLVEEKFTKFSGEPRDAALDTGLRLSRGAAKRSPSPSAAPLVFLFVPKF